MAILKLKRNIRSNIGMGEPVKSQGAISVDASGARYINELPSYQKELALEAMRDGVSLPTLASYFGTEGWLTVTEKTFTQYLGAFKRVYPEQLRLEDSDSLNTIVSKRKPQMDEEQALEQLIRVQSRRIKIGVDFETQTRIVNPNLHRDMNTARELIDTLANIRGRGKGQARQIGGSVSITATNEAKETLRSVDRTEAGQEKLVSMFGSLAGLIKARANHD